MGLRVLLTSVGALALTDFGALVFGLESLGLAAVLVFRGTGSPPHTDSGQIVINDERLAHAN